MTQWNNERTSVTGTLWHISDQKSDRYDETWCTHSLRRGNGACFHSSLVLFFVLFVLVQAATLVSGGIDSINFYEPERDKSAVNSEHLVLISSFKDNTKTLSHWISWEIAWETALLKDEARQRDTGLSWKQLVWSFTTHSVFLLLWHFEIRSGQVCNTWQVGNETRASALWRRFAKSSFVGTTMGWERIVWQPKSRHSLLHAFKCFPHFTELHSGRCCLQYNSP